MTPIGARRRAAIDKTTRWRLAGPLTAEATGNYLHTNKAHKILVNKFTLQNHQLAYKSYYSGLACYWKQKLTHRFAHQHIAGLAFIGGRRARALVRHTNAAAGDAWRLRTPINQTFRLFARPTTQLASAILIANERVVLVASVGRLHAIAGALLRQ